MSTAPDEDPNALTNLARRLGLARGSAAVPALGGDNTLVDKLRTLGLARKAPEAASKPEPAGAPTDADALSKRLAAFRAAPSGAAPPAPAASPYGSAVEIPPPVAMTRAAGPIVRHFRVLEPKMQHRAGTILTRPAPAA